MTSKSNVIDRLKVEPLKPEQFELTISDAIWVATALLHQKSSLEPGFSRDDITNKVRDRRLTKGQYRSVWQHVDSHSVANRPPNPNRTRMLVDIGHGIRRLFRPGDPFDLRRDGSPYHPDWSALPVEIKSLELERWYRGWCQQFGAPVEQQDPLLSGAGVAKHLWPGLSGDAYVEELRKGWDDQR